MHAGHCQVNVSKQYDCEGTGTCTGYLQVVLQKVVGLVLVSKLVLAPILLVGVTHGLQVGRGGVVLHHGNGQRLLLGLVGGAE